MATKEKDSFLENSGLITTFNAILNYLQVGLSNNPNKDSKNELIRTQKIIQVIKGFLIQIDTDFISADIHNKLKASIQAIESYIKNFPLHTSTVSALKQQNDNLLAILPALKYCNHDDLSYSYIVETEEKLNILHDNIEQNNNKIHSNINEYNSILDNIKNKANTIENYFEKEKEKCEKYFEDYKKQIDNSRVELEKKYIEQISKYREDCNSDKTSLFNSLQNECQNIKEDQKKEFEIILNESRQQSEKIKSFYHIVASDSISGNFLQTAQDEKRSATSLRNWGIGILSFYGVLLLFLVIILLSIKEFNAPWQAYTLFFTMSACVISLSVYLLTQSERHRNTSFWANQMYLEVHAFEPFLETFDNESNKDQLRQQFIEKVFGKIYNPKLTLNADNNSYAGMPIEKITEFIDKCIEKIKK